MYRKYVNMKGIIEMDKLIKWLFQQTTDGATYLQVIVVGILIIVVFNFLFDNLEDIFESKKRKDGK